MAAELLARYPGPAGAVFSLAEDVLGMPLRQLCVSGSAGELRRTDVTQPAVLATSLAVLAVLQDRGLAPAGAAGHSLGEYAALVAAGALRPDSALRLARRRGQLMAGVGDRVDGAMVAIVGLAAEHIERLCTAVAGGGVEVANYNEPAQVVISGRRRPVELVCRQALAAGAERAVALDVAAPFHCWLMRTVEAELGAELDRCDIAAPQLPLLSAVTGDYVRTAEQARLLLRRQLTGPVRWVETARRAALHHDAFVEVGPGRVLTGLTKRIAPNVPAYSTGTPKAIETVLAQYARAKATI
jgi:[acyl-carrier-protein] S-malonyltransferase